MLRLQLGKRLRGFGALTSERKALAASFLAYAAGDKKECLALLDAVSASYTENEVPACLVLTQPAFQKKVARIWNSHKKLRSASLLKRHVAFELPWFMALLTLAPVSYTHLGHENLGQRQQAAHRPESLPDHRAFGISARCLFA